MIHFRIRYEGLRRRLARRRRRVAILRGAWMALVPVALALAVSVVVRQRPSPRVWAPVSLGVLAISGIWIARPRSLREIGHALDSAFGLDDLLVTALEVDRRGPQGALEESLLDDAATALAEIEAQGHLTRDSAVAEAEALAGTVAVVAGLYLVAAAQSGSASLPRLGPVAAAGGTVTGQSSRWVEASIAPTVAPETSAAGATGPGTSAAARGDDATSGGGSAPGGAEIPDAAQAAAGGGQAPGRLTTPAPLGGPRGALPLPTASAAGGAEARSLQGRGDDVAVSSGSAMVRGGGQGASTAAAGTGPMPWGLRAAIRRYFGGG